MAVPRAYVYEIRRFWTGLQYIMEFFMWQPGVVGYGFIPLTYLRAET